MLVKLSEKAAAQRSDSENYSAPRGAGLPQTNVCCRRRLRSLVKRVSAGEARCTAQVFLDAQELIVFGNPVCSRQRTRFDLAGIRRYGQVSYKSIFGLA